MTATTKKRTLSPADVDALSQRFADVFMTFNADTDTFAPDAFFDLNMPVWRFQIQGATEFGSQLAQIAHGNVRVDVLRTVPTTSGFVTEHHEHQTAGGEEFSAGRLWLCDVADGRIVDVVGYCSGEWNEELRRRHAVEAPMIRP